MAVSLQVVDVEVVCALQVAKRVLHRAPADVPSNPQWCDRELLAALTHIWLLKDWKVRLHLFLLSCKMTIVGATVYLFIAEMDIEKQLSVTAAYAAHGLGFLFIEPSGHFDGSMAPPTIRLYLLHGGLLIVKGLSSTIVPLKKSTPGEGVHKSLYYENRLLSVVENNSASDN